MAYLKKLKFTFDYFDLYRGKLYFRAMILVTGGSGFLGAHILAQLTQKHPVVRALFRNPKGLDKVREVFGYYFENQASYFDKIEWIQCDLNDITTLSEAVNGVSEVYHVAGLINFEWRRHDELKSTNTTGTENLVNCCLEAKVQKLCYISSIAAMGQKSNAQDQDALTPGVIKDPYGLTKYGGELEVWRGAQEGLNVIILRPGVILGEGFWRSGSGVLLKFVSSEPKWYPPGGTGFVDVKDVAAFALRLMEAGKYNLTLTLVGHNMSYLEVLQKIGRALGSKKPPKWAVPLWVGLLGHYVDYLRAMITGAPEKLPKAYLDAMFEMTSYDGQPAALETQCSYTELEHTLQRICSLAPYKIK